MGRGNIDTVGRRSAPRKIGAAAPWALIAALCAAPLSGCNSGNQITEPTEVSASGPGAPAVPAAPAVSITPAAMTMLVGNTASFAAAVANDVGAAGVTWSIAGTSCTGSACGSLSSMTANPVVYTAPAAAPTAPITLTATSNADRARISTVTVTVLAGVGNGPVAVAPVRAAVTTSQPQGFAAALGGVATAVSWDVDGQPGGSAAVGTIDANGVYRPPTSAGTHLITATSVADTSKKGTAAVAVTDLTGVLTQRNDATRTGQNLQEYALSPATVTPSSFGKLFACPVDGAVYAQPLYVANLAIGGGTHNVLFVATEHNGVYAFDADDKACTAYWFMSFNQAGVTPVPPADTGVTGDLPKEIGITSTPVISATNRALYVIAKTKENGNYVQRLHALDLATGNEKPGAPVAIQGTVTTAAAGTRSFDALRHLQRAALLISGNRIVAAFASHGDVTPYYGWVLTYDATTLAQTGVYNATPNGGMGGVWMSGAGPAADAAGDIYLSTGNGAFDQVTDYSEALLKLAPTGAALADFFAPSDVDQLNAGDTDFGSGGVVVVPDTLGSAAHPHLVLAGGKDGRLFVIDRDNLGKFTAGGPDKVVQTHRYCNGCGGLYAAPAIWGQNLYIVGNGDAVKQFTFAAGAIATNAAAQSAESYGFPGASPVVSAQGASNGIVWVLDTNRAGAANASASGPAVLRAYDARNVATRLFSSDLKATDRADDAVKFVVPTVANGKVYVAGQTMVTVYGLLP